MIRDGTTAAQRTGATFTCATAARQCGGSAADGNAHATAHRIMPIACLEPVVLGAAVRNGNQPAWRIAATTHSFTRTTGAARSSETKARPTLLNVTSPPQTLSCYRLTLFRESNSGQISSAHLNEVCRFDCRDISKCHGSQGLNARQGHASCVHVAPSPSSCWNVPDALL